MAGHALQEKEPGLLGEDRVGRPTGVTRHILLDVATQDVLDMLLLEATLDDQLIAAVDGTHSTQLGRQKGEKVLGLSVEPVGNNEELIAMWQWTREL